jgi:transposase
MNFILKSALLFSFIYSSPPFIENLGEAAVDAAKIMNSFTKNSHSVNPVNIEKTGWTQHITNLPKRKTAILNVDDLVSKRHKPNDLEKIGTGSLEHESNVVKKRPYKHFTEDEKIFIQNELNAGVSVKDIGLKLGRNPPSISTWKINENKKRGVLPVVERKRFSEDEKKIVLDQTAAGKSYAEIGKDLRRSAQSISMAALRERRRQGVPVVEKKLFSEDERKLILEQVSAGNSYANIANDLGRSISSINKVVFRQRRKQGVSAGVVVFSEKEKEIIFKNYLAGRSFDEIAKELKRSSKSISSLIWREKSKNPAKFEKQVR